MKPEGLDKWVDKKNPSQNHSKSILSAEAITRYSLKERILELEKMRDQILYELDKLKTFSEDRKL